MVRRLTFSVWTVMTGSRFRKIATRVSPTNASPMVEKTMIFRRFLDFGLAMSSNSKTLNGSDLFQKVEPFAAECDFQEATGRLQAGPKIVSPVHLPQPGRTAIATNRAQI